MHSIPVYSIYVYLLNEMFQAKSTQYKSLKAYKKLYTTLPWTYKPGMYPLAW